MKPEQLRNRILAADLAWIPVALAAEQLLCTGVGCRHLPLGPSNFVVYIGCTIFAWVLLSENLPLDGFRGGWRLPALVSHLLLAVALLMVLLLAVQNVSAGFVGRFTLSVFSSLLLAGFLAIRWLALRRVLRRYRKGEVNRVVILGSDSLASEVAAKFHHHPELLCQVVGFLCPGAEASAPRSARPGAAVPATVSTMEVVNLLRRQKIDELVMAHTPASNEILNLVALCRQQSILVSLVPQPYELYLSRPSLLDLGGLPLLRLDGMQPRSLQIGKRVLDLGLGCFLAVATLPVLAISAATVRLSTGRAFRWEKRIGLGGVPFSMLRLNVDHNAPAGPRFAHILCQFSISELPQFWNVLRGEMSLVGPRPESPERAHHYSAWQQQRLSVLPGMTGLAQVHGLREEHASDAKTRHDLQYMLHPSLLKDLALLIETVWTLLFRLPQLRKNIRSADHGTEALPPQCVSFPPIKSSFPEIFQHAHRTQSGSD
jgi:lipopolysaccharide/colanic/teichoic acid biosynthesis glycosyltransferase